MKDLESALRAAARESLPDEGFTQRVLSSLPAPAPAAQPWLRPALVLGSATLGSVLAVGLGPGGAALLEGFADLVQLRALTPAAAAGLAMAGALLVSAIVLAVEAE